MINIKITTNYIVAFSLLTLLCGLSHEMVHHLTAAAMCGCWGYKTFNSFYFCESCPESKWNYLATIAGPLFTFALMWIGRFQINHGTLKSKHMGFALIFANFPINRMIYVLLNSNDEQWAAKNLFGSSTLVSLTTIVLVFLCTVPPLISAYQHISNNRKNLYFIGFYILPFVFILFFAGFFLEEYLLQNLKFLSNTFLGIPYLLLLTEVVCSVGYFLTKRHLCTHQYEDTK